MSVLIPSDFIEKYVEFAQASQRSTGVLASVTIGQAILESGWGESELAKNANNFFGIKGEYNGQYYYKETSEYIGGSWINVRTKFRKYPSSYNSFCDHGMFLKDGKYSNCWQYVGDPFKFVEAVAKAGYATDPNYASKVCDIIVLYDLTVYDLKVVSDLSQHWAYSSFKRLKDLGIMKGRDTTDFSLSDVIGYGEIAVLLCRMIDYFEKK